MNKLMTIASHSTPALILVFGMTSAALASDLSRYRDFHFGMDLPAVSAQMGPTTSEVKVIHRRPALIQELEWAPQPRDSAYRPDSVQQVVFRFYDGKLFGIVVNYDRYETEGLTAPDVIEAISATYGAADTAALDNKGARERYADEVIAVWQDPDYRFELVRAPYGPSFKLIGVQKSLQAAAQTAVAEAKWLDDVEAPQREAARVISENELQQAKLDKSRLVNKPKFRP